MSFMLFGSVRKWFQYGSNLASGELLKDLVEWSAKLLEDYKNEDVKEIKRIDRDKVKLCPPLPGLTKINVDAALVPADGCFGGGMTARDHCGKLKAAGADCFSTPATDLEAKLKAIQ